MIIAVHQPNYLPWLGYFHKMLSCDMFIILDDVLHSKSAITNKNTVKGANSIIQLSVPLSLKGVPLKEVTICNDGKWNHKHWLTLQRSYSKTPYWDAYQYVFKSIYMNPKDRLAELNLQLIEGIRNIFEIRTPMIRSSEIPGISGTGFMRIVNLCKELGADTYLSGIGARVYNDEKEFTNHNVRLVYQEFTHPNYPQLWGDFVPNLSAIDLLFNCGSNSKKYLTKQLV